MIRHWAHGCNPPESVTQTANIATRSNWRRHCLYTTVTAAVYIVGVSSRNSFAQEIKTWFSLVPGIFCPLRKRSLSVWPCSSISSRLTQINLMPLLLAFFWLPLICTSGATKTSQASDLFGWARKKLSCMARQSVNDSSKHGTFQGQEKTMPSSPVQIDCRLAQFLELMPTMCDTV